MTRLQPLFKAVGFFLIIGLCVLAQAQFLAHSAVGYLPLGVAGVLALIVIAPVPRGDVLRRDAGALDLARGWRRWLGVVLLVVGVVFVAYSARLFHEQLLIIEIPDDGPWIAFGIGLALAFVGALLLVGVGRLPRPDGTVLILLGILALAIFVRVYQVDQYPFGVWFDEALYGLHARHVLETSAFRPVFIDNLTFPHLLAYALSLEVFGAQTITGMRVVSALLASAGVVVAYLVGRELRGAWFGLLMAFLLAVLRWSIDFSRIAMTGAELSTFVLLTFYAALRLMRYGRLRDGLWFGLLLALGVYFYRSYEAQMIAVAVYLLVAYPFLRRRWRRTVALGLTALVAAVVVVIPLIVFFIDRNDIYMGRLNQVSIFNEDLSPGMTVTDAIGQSTLRHLEMFHLRGDANGRHNLPGEPELDPVIGSLLVIGLFMALRERRREHLFFALSLIAALLSGILSLFFEAPQSLRAIGAIVGVIYFGALGLEGMIRLALAWLSALLRSRRDCAGAGGRRRGERAGRDGSLELQRLLQPTADESGGLARLFDRRDAVGALPDQLRPQHAVLSVAADRHAAAGAVSGGGRTDALQSTGHARRFPPARSAARIRDHALAVRRLLSGRSASLVPQRDFPHRAPARLRREIRPRRRTVHGDRSHGGRRRFD